MNTILLLLLACSESVPNQQKDVPLTVEKTETVSIEDRIVGKWMFVTSHQKKDAEGEVRWDISCDETWFPVNTFSSKCRYKNTSDIRGSQTSDSVDITLSGTWKVVNGVVYQTISDRNAVLISHSVPQIMNDPSIRESYEQSIEGFFLVGETQTITTKDWLQGSWVHERNIMRDLKTIRAIKMK